MAVKLTCSSCGKTYNLADQYVGKKVRCTSCQQINVVQGTPAVREQPEQATQAASEQTKSRVAERGSVRQRTDNSNGTMGAQSKSTPPAPRPDRSPNSESDSAEDLPQLEAVVERDSQFASQRGQADAALEEGEDSGDETAAGGAEATTRRPGRKKKGSRKKQSSTKLLIVSIVLGVILLVGGTGGVFALIAYRNMDAPEVDAAKEADLAAQIGNPTFHYARDGNKEGYVVHLMLRFKKGTVAPDHDYRPLLSNHRLVVKTPKGNHLIDIDPNKVQQTYGANHGSSLGTPILSGTPELPTYIHLERKGALFGRPERVSNIVAIAISPDGTDPLAGLHKSEERSRRWMEEAKAESSKLVEEFKRSKEREKDIDGLLVDLKDPQKRSATLGTLGRMKPGERQGDIAKALVPLLNDSDFSTRSQAWRLMEAKWGTRDQVPLFVKMLSNKDSEQIGHALRALKLVKDERSIEPVATFLKVPKHQQDALAVLDAIGTPAEDVILPYLDTKYPTLLFQAIWFAKESGTKKSLPALEKLANSSNALFAKNAQDAIKAINSRK